VTRLSGVQADPYLRHDAARDFDHDGTSIRPDLANPE
jgi:hypothetical protein